jgi:hypothetical protein
MAVAPTTVVVAALASGGRDPCGDKWPRQPSGSDEGGPWCQVHNYRHHSAEECPNIKKLTEQFREQQKQQPRRDDMPPRQWEDK